MDARARKEFVALYRKAGLSLSATCADFGVNYGDAAKAARGVELLRRAVEQAVDLETGLVTTHIGGLPKTNAAACEETMIGNLNEAGRYAENTASASPPKPVSKTAAGWPVCSSGSTPPPSA